MTVTLSGASISTCTQRVLIAAAEVGIDVEMHNIDWVNKEHKSEAWLEKQPWGKVPILDDDDLGFTLFESRAIARYLAAKAKSPLVPQPTDADYLAKLARFENAASIEYSNFDPHAGGLAFELIFKKVLGLGEPDEARVATLTATLTTSLNAYEKILSKQAFLAGDDLSLADLFHVPYGQKLFIMGKGDLIESRPNVARWWKAITDRDSVRKVTGSK